MTRVAVIGATGFIGSAVVQSLREQGHEAIAVRVPRVHSHANSVAGAVREAKRLADETSDWWQPLRHAQAIVNAAGCASAASVDGSGLVGANAVLPRLLAEVAESLGLPARFVHISSAAVQGRLPLTEEPENSPFSPYSMSKAFGERALPNSDKVVVYRPTSVHGRGRAVTASVIRLAKSRLSSVAGAGNQPTPQVLVENVGSAAAYLATTHRQPPRVVLHPWEGLTTASFLRVLGGHEPRSVPVGMATGIVNVGIRLGHVVPSVAARARRLELLWFGQRQGSSWLSRVGWEPPVGLEGWELLATATGESSKEHR